jgi:hypothetical protein
MIDRLGLRAAWLVATSLALLLPAMAFGQAPPPTGTDMELDPDAKPAQPTPPPTEEEKKPEELPPVEAGSWGVGGKEQEGRFAPGGQKKVEVKAPEEKADPLGPPGSINAEVVLGFGAIRDVLNDSGPTDIFVASMLFGAQYRFGDTWTIGVRFPYSTASTDGPLETIDDFNSFAVGNLEVSVRPAFRLTPRLRLPVGVAFDLPFASGDPFPEANAQGERAQALVAQSAISARGFEEYALFASSRFGLVPSVGILYDKAPMHIAGWTKVELMFKTGGNEPPPVFSAASVADPATNWVTGGSFAWDLFGARLTPMLRTWVAVATPPVSLGTSDYAGALWVIEPRVSTTWSLNEAKSLAVQGGVGYILPVAGELGGDATATGLRIQAAFLF